MITQQPEPMINFSGKIYKNKTRLELVKNNNNRPYNKIDSIEMIHSQKL